MKKNRKIILIILSVIAAVVLAFSTAVGTYMWHEQRQQDEMVKIVKSDEVEVILNDWMKNVDPKAFTEEGVIKTYEIDMASIKHSPMGGIKFRVYINKKENLYINCTIGKDLTTGKLEGQGGGVSADLVKLLERD